MFKDKVISTMLLQPFNIIEYSIKLYFIWDFHWHVKYYLKCSIIMNVDPGIWNTDSENIVPSMTI